MTRASQTQIPTKKRRAARHFSQRKKKTSRSLFRVDVCGRTPSSLANATRHSGSVKKGKRLKKKEAKIASAIHPPATRYQLEMRYALKGRDGERARGSGSGHARPIHFRSKKDALYHKTALHKLFHFTEKIRLS